MQYNNENNHLIFTRRATIILLGQLGLFSVLVARLQYLQIQQSKQYGLLAEENSINIELVAPLRGRIFDRFGEVIATNKDNYQVVIMPDQVKEYVLRTLSMLEKIIPISSAKKQKLLKEISKSKGIFPVTIAKNLTWQQFSMINLQTPHLSGIQTYIGRTRFYPSKDSFSHVIGYVGSVDKNINHDPLLSIPDFKIGKSGLEYQFDEHLRGQAGNRRVEVNNIGRVIREISLDQGISGRSLTTTLDAKLQRMIQKRLQKYVASVTLMDIHTGEILALVSLPSFDANQFSTGLSHKQWDILLEDKHKPLTNKVIAGQYSPGSTMKMIVVLAALEEGISRNEVVECKGKYHLGKEVFHCWKKEGHGKVNLLEALKYSCDTYFYGLSMRLGIDSIEHMAKRFGFGDKTGIDLMGEKKGLVPSRHWKKKNFNTKWQAGETIITGIGQGYMLTTPLQLVVMMARLANGGYKVKPKLLHAIDNKIRPIQQYETMNLNATHLKFIHDALFEAVNRGGTGARGAFSVGGKKMSGKTGTVQVRRITRAERKEGVISNEDLEWHLRDHALFVGFAPSHLPQYALSVVLDHGGSGALAAKIAGDIMKYVVKHDPLQKKIYTLSG